jgi:hypothetical protein
MRAVAKEKERTGRAIDEFAEQPADVGPNGVHEGEHLEHGGNGRTLQLYSPRPKQ